MVCPQFMPQDHQILEEFVSLSLAQSIILSVYDSMESPSSSLLLSSGRGARLSNIERLIMCWWMFTGFTHIIREGYLAFSPEFYKDKTGCFFVQVWKEHSKGTSRYAARNAGVVTIEGLTAVFEGPTSLFAAYAIAKRKSYNDLLQISIFSGQIYGSVAYYITKSYYYWYYYVVFWIWIPTLVVIRSWKKICIVAFRSQESTHKKNKTE
ncbi:hypothetical protein MKW98_019053 [Papaver atlanticum]|uniref:EXPERA domain-containing protein n=1 Tax=Papaver atlanticum TaxID=357466 RepID=A0AAD4TJB2_9MAGN|nr:hypothetical protein MKW98_019053 [Papaver atlanticum]